MASPPLPAFAVIAASLLACAHAPLPRLAAQTPERVPFVAGTGSAVVVPVLVNGRGPYPFMVDTGASHTSIDADLARHLGAPRVAKTLVSTTAGDDWAAVVKLRQVALGPLDAHEVLATEVPPGRLDGVSRVLGLIGRDLLGTRAFTIDYVLRQLEWPPAPAQDRAAALPLDTRGRIWLVPVRSGSRTLRLVPDSGAEVTLLFDRGHALNVAYRGGTIGVQSVTGSRPARRGIVPRLEFGGLRLVEHEVVVVNGADVDPDHGDGVLPLHLFDRVTFRPEEASIQLSQVVAPSAGAARVQ
ncbi:MAG TPA: retroviral-like aspartic protease family protein [Vicinamibacterales bacterium]|nr:retroviral-like aspartic protease family protein [Vicinamibacterales bacterium]